MECKTLTQPPGQYGSYFTDDIFKCIFMNEKFWIEFHWSLFHSVQLTISQHWLRWWIGTGQATSHYLNQCWPSSQENIKAPSHWPLCEEFTGDRWHRAPLLPALFDVISIWFIPPIFETPFWFTFESFHVLFHFVSAWSLRHISLENVFEFCIRKFKFRNIWGVTICPYTLLLQQLQQIKACPGVIHDHCWYFSHRTQGPVYPHSQYHGCRWPGNDVIFFFSFKYHEVKVKIQTWIYVFKMNPAQQEMWISCLSCTSIISTDCICKCILFLNNWL